VILVKKGTKQKVVQHLLLNWTEKHRKEGVSFQDLAGAVFCMRCFAFLWLRDCQSATSYSQLKTTRFTQLHNFALHYYELLNYHFGARKETLIYLSRHVATSYFMQYILYRHAHGLSLWNMKTRTAFLESIKKATDITFLWLTLTKSVHFLLSSHQSYIPNSSLYLIINASGKWSRSDLIPLHWKQADSG
jgi:hypothetical protein